MDLTPDPSFEALRGMIASLGRERLRPLGIEADRAGAALDSSHPFFREALEMGLTGGFTGRIDRPNIDRPNTDHRKSDGRVRKSARRAVVMAEEAAYWDRGMATSLPGPGLAAAPLLLLGTPEQRERWLGVFKDKSEPRWGAFAMSEPGAGSDVAAIQTTARRDGDGWVLDGEKTFISNGARACWVAVWATVDRSRGREGHRCFVVTRDAPGFEVLRVDKKMGLVASQTATLRFDGCRIAADQLLGGEQAYADRSGFKGAMKSFNMTRPMVAAMAVGIARAVVDETRRFVAEHGQSFTARRRTRAQQRLRRSERRLEAGRLLCWRAAWLADQQQDNALEASIAKDYCAPMALEVASLGLEVLRSAGASSDYLIEKLYRDVKALDIVEGTQEIQRLVIARRLIGHRDDRQAQGAQSHG
jgi:acyl-CoA dehydrogenase